jgi:HipA-like C-terminal domain
VGVTSLLSIDMSFYGKLDTWIAAANRLRQDRRIDAETLEQVRLAYTFAGLIANTDRHFGNLACFDNYEGGFQLAPIYDMLPMLFAPEHNQIAARVFDPPGPVSDTLGAWGRARTFAERYWRQRVADERISDDFKKICATCVAALEALPRT